MAVQTPSTSAGRASFLRRPRGLRGRFGLRRQILAAFTLGALLLSVLLSLIAYSLTRSSLLDRIDEAASTRLTENAEFLASGIAADTTDEEIRSLIVRVNRPSGVEPVLLVGGRSFSPRAFGFTVDDIDQNLRDAVSERDSFKMRYRRSEVVTTNPTFDSGTAADRPRHSRTSSPRSGRWGRS